MLAYMVINTPCNLGVPFEEMYFVKTNSTIGDYLPRKDLLIMFMISVVWSSDVALKGPDMTLTVGAE